MGRLFRSAAKPMGRSVACPPSGPYRHGGGVYLIDVLSITADHNAVLLPLKVVPGASRTRYLGEWDGRAKVAVAAPPEKGKANKAIIAFFSKLLGVRKTDITIVAGHTSTTKKIRIERVTADRLRTALQPDPS